eukprot:scaffold7821_cov99-Isochrysis_galbana.AAC.3
MLAHVKLESGLEPVETPPREGVDGGVGADAHEPGEIAGVLCIRRRGVEGTFVHRERRRRGGRAGDRRGLRGVTPGRLPDESDALPHLENVALAGRDRGRGERVVVWRAVGWLHRPVHCLRLLPFVRVDGLAVHVAKGDG